MQLPRLIFAVALVGSAWASAQSANPGDVASNLYQVEVVIFKNRANYGSEQPLDDVGRNFPSPAVYLIDPTASSSTNADLIEEQDGLVAVTLEANRPGDDSGDAMSDELLAALDEELPNAAARYSLLPDTTFNLRADANAMRRNGNYEVVAHMAWHQPLESVSQAKWVLLQAGSEFDGRREIEGTLRLSLDLYLYTEARLWYSPFNADLLQYGNLDEEPSGKLLPPLPVRWLSEAERREKELAEMAAQAAEEELGNAPSRNPSERVTAFGDDISPSATTRIAADDPALVELMGNELETLIESEPRYPIDGTWRIGQRQKMQLQDLVYFDNPAFGLLLRVTRVAVAEQ